MIKFKFSFTSSERELKLQDGKYSSKINIFQRPHKHTHLKAKNHRIYIIGVLYVGGKMRYTKLCKFHYNYCRIAENSNNLFKIYLNFVIYLNHEKQMLLKIC